tara:strand:- start:45 stop:392 length:348 start_codon:yes stop_codon:yes gene_type:complete
MSNIFKNLPFDIQEKIRNEYLIDELEVRYNKNMMIHQLQHLHSYADIELQEYMGESPDIYSDNDIMIFIKDSMILEDILDFEFPKYNNWIWNFGKSGDKYIIKKDGNKFRKLYYK